MHPLARLDHQYVWHPFTQMRDWLRQEPIVIVAGQGAVLRDVHGREYLDGNSSIWTNLHGHNHPRLNAALQRQLGKIAHTSALGLANEPAARLAEQLVRLANPSAIGAPSLGKVFFSDDGSTAMEVALKLAYEHARRCGRSRKPRFLTLAGAYHGDTVGAVSLGHIPLFHQTFGGLLFKTDSVMAPFCYRCKFNQAEPARADAREYRRCHWECVDQVAARFEQRRRGEDYAGFVFEPLIQGAAGMIPQPTGWLGRVAELARGHGTPLIADEVLTGFGRTGVGHLSDVPGKARLQDSGVRGSHEPKFPLTRPSGTRSPSAREGWGKGEPSILGNPFPADPAGLFACHHEGVQPDFLALAKGLTGGYLPLAATLTTETVFGSFLGEYEEFKTFFHGHSFTGNPLGAATALASLGLLQQPSAIRHRARLEATLRRELAGLWRLPAVGDIRQVGLIVGVELVRDWRTRRPFDLREQAGMRVCAAMARRGVLTRPVGNVVVLMPPYCTTRRQAEQMVAALHDAVDEVLGPAALSGEPTARAVGPAVRGSSGRTAGRAGSSGPAAASPRIA